jgi:hypothetical protein
MPKVRKVSHGRIKERYNPTPTPAEKLHHISVMEHGCLVCMKEAVAHHILQNSTFKRSRRDHQQVVPLCNHHHAELHTYYGNELAWQANYGLDLACEAQDFWLFSKNKGLF